jgi:DNA-binding transcriptional LysR family regulator
MPRPAIAAVRLLNRTSRRFGMTDAGEEFYCHAVLMLREADAIG